MCEALQLKALVLDEPSLQSGKSLSNIQQMCTEILAEDYFLIRNHLGVKIVLGLKKESRLTQML